MFRVLQFGIDAEVFGCGTHVRKYTAF
jgi:hypothetical protein